MNASLKILSLFFVIVLAFNACNDDPETLPYGYSYATYVETNENSFGYFLDLDSGGKIIPQNTGSIDSGVKTGSRVVAYFYVASDSGTAENRIIKANMDVILELLTKDITQLTLQNTDSIGNDPIHIHNENIWMTEKHLNIYFEYSGGSRTHFINLVKPIGQQTDSLGRQILEFRHNANDDWGTYWLNSVVSFDMTSLQQPTMDSIQFVMRSLDYDYSKNEYIGTFHFNSDALKLGIQPAPSIEKNERFNLIK